MSKKVPITAISKFIFGQVSHKVNNTRYGTAITKRLNKEKVINYHVEEIFPYDKTSNLSRLKEDQIKEEIMLEKKASGRGGPKKGEGKKSKIRKRK